MRMQLFDARRRHADGAARRFPSLEQMEEMLKMGMEEGLREAVGQMDALLRS